MKGRAVVGIVISLAGICLIVFFAYIVLILDPFNWGEVHSARFSWDKFSRIKEGDAIGKVIESLGDPVEPPKPFSFILASASDPCKLGGCRRYLFFWSDLGSIL